MIFWIDKEHKNDYKDSSIASGIRYKLHNYGNDFEEDKRTDRSLEIEANKWAKYIVNLYFKNKKGYFQDKNESSI